MDKIKKLAKKVAEWHEDMTDEIRWKFHLSNYQMMWFAYFEGVVTTLFVLWIMR